VRGEERSVGGGKKEAPKGGEVVGDGRAWLAVGKAIQSVTS
jgi:hypothetical protein